MSDSSADAGYTLSCSVDLLFPETFPQAVLYAVFDNEPLTNFRANLAERGWNQIASTKDETTRSIQLMAIWDQMFDHVPGSSMGVAAPRDTPRLIIDPSTGKKTVEMSTSSLYIKSNMPSQGRTKWIVSRAHSHRGTPMAWCIPVSIGRNEATKISFAPENARTLESIAREASA